MIAPAVAASAKAGLFKRLVKVTAVITAVALAPIALALPSLLGVVAIASTPPVRTGDGPQVVGQWGAPQVGYAITDYFGPRAGCGVCSTYHRGVDLTAGCGSSIYAAGPGVVSAVGWDGSFGVRVVIDHGAGIQTLYAHQPEGGPTVQEGDHVAAGVRVGTEGTTGASTGCHLHFEVRVSGVATDPLPFMLQRGVQL